MWFQVLRVKSALYWDIHIWFDYAFLKRLPCGQQALGF